MLCYVYMCVNCNLMVHDKGVNCERSTIIILISTCTDVLPIHYLTMKKSDLRNHEIRSEKSEMHLCSVPIPYCKQVSADITCIYQIYYIFMVK